MKNKSLKFRAASKNELILTVSFFLAIIIFCVYKAEYIILAGVLVLTVQSTIGAFVDIIRIKDGLVYLKENIYSKTIVVSIGEIDQIQTDQIGSEMYVIRLYLSGGNEIDFQPNSTYRNMLPAVKALIEQSKINT